MSKYNPSDRVEHYNSVEEFIQRNPNSPIMARALAKYVIEKGTGDLLSFKGNDSLFYKRAKKAVGVFCEKIESAHRSAGKSSLTFKLAS